MNRRNLVEHQIIDAPRVYCNLALIIVEDGEFHLHHFERVAYGRDDADAIAILCRLFRCHLFRCRLFRGCRFRRGLIAGRRLCRGGGCSGQDQQQRDDARKRTRKYCLEFIQIPNADMVSASPYHSRVLRAFIGCGFGCRKQSRGCSTFYICVIGRDFDLILVGVPAAPCVILLTPSPTPKHVSCILLGPRTGLPRCLPSLHDEGFWPRARRTDCRGGRPCST